MGCGSSRPSGDLSLPDAAPPLPPPGFLPGMPSSPQKQIVPTWPASTYRLNVIDDEFFIRLVVSPPAGTAGPRVCIEVPTAAAERPAGEPAFSDLQRRGILACGNFGCVQFVVDRTTQVGYALKSVLKYSPNERWSSQCLRELLILTEVDDARCPFALGAVEAYQDKFCLHILMPLATGGELSTHLKKIAPLSPSDARFYVGSVVLALTFLHGLQIVYRDLKPENVVLDGWGYVKIVDFGFAKKLEKDAAYTRTYCGTPQFLAPEILNDEPHGFAVDWWCLGIFTYECCTGIDAFSSTAPTDGDTQNALFERIVEGAYAWPATKHLHKENVGAQLQIIKDLVEKLLTEGAAERLGSGRRGASAPLDVQAHDFFTRLGDQLGGSPSQGSPVHSRTSTNLTRASSTPSPTGRRASTTGPTYFELLEQRGVPAPFLPSSTVESIVADGAESNKNANPLDRMMAMLDGDANFHGFTEDEEEDFCAFSSAWAVPWRRRDGEDVDFEYTTEVPPRTAPRTITAPSPSRKKREEASPPNPSVEPSPSPLKETPPSGFFSRSRRWRSPSPNSKRGPPRDSKKETAVTVRDGAYISQMRPNRRRISNFSTPSKPAATAAEESSAAADVSSPSTMKDNKAAGGLTLDARLQA